MSFSIQSKTSKAIIGGIGSPTNPGTFTVTSGSFPLYSGQTISGTNGTISYNYFTFFGKIGRAHV